MYISANGICLSDTENVSRELEIYQQGNRIDDGGDKRAGHNGGVKADSVGNQRQGTADDLGTEDGDNECQADDQGYRDGQAVKQEQFDKVANSQCRTAQKCHAHLFPDDAEDIFEFDIA